LQPNGSFEQYQLPLVVQGAAAPRAKAGSAGGGGGGGGDSPDGGGGGNGAGGFGNGAVSPYYHNDPALLQRLSALETAGLETHEILKKVTERRAALLEQQYGAMALVSRKKLDVCNTGFSSATLIPTMFHQRNFVEMCE
jgi:hypothetical protein